LDFPPGASTPDDAPAAARILGNPAAEKMEMSVIKQWFADKGDATLRLDFPLTRESIVLDVGGYEGNWAAEIYERYCCTVHIFEPVPRFAENIQKRFAPGARVFVHPYGLSDRSQQATIYLNNDGTSVHKNKGSACTIELRSAHEIFGELGLSIIGVDLLKINIEGCEYELLPHVINSPLIHNVRDIQVQFHDFVPEAAARMAAIQEQLSRTHELMWQYRFVWENWRLKHPKGITL
jgi:FkbM family methyltransferase